MYIDRERERMERERVHRQRERTERVEEPELSKNKEKVGTKTETS